MSNRFKGWLFVLGQFTLIGLSIVLPATTIDGVIPHGAQLLAAVSVIVGLISAFNLRKSLTVHPIPLERAKLVTSGAYRFCRHPIYLALILLIGASTATAPSLPRIVVWLLLVILLWQKANWEEKFLLDKFPEYAEYSQRVGRFTPWF